MSAPRIAFFGTPDIAVFVLDELSKAGIRPSLVITNPDRPVGRKMLLTPPSAKVWATEHDIKIFQPESLNNAGVMERLTKEKFDLFVVVAYGTIIPKALLVIPKYGTLNVHPSLLPRLRGPSPIRTAILNDMRETGVTVMLMDEEMDHGPIIADEKIEIAKDEWPMRGRELDERLSRAGGCLLVRVIPAWLGGRCVARAQNHADATFCKKITKADGELDLGADPMPTGRQAYQNLLKIRAYDGWPGTFFFFEKDGKKVRIKITDAELAPDGSLNILKVIPEGKKEMSYGDFL